MKTSAKVALTTILIAIPAVALAAHGPVDQQAHFWLKVWTFGKGQAEVTPTSAQLPLFMLLSVFEGVGMGLAVSFLAWGRPGVRRLAGTGWRANVLYFGSAWVVGNWWVHDSLHITNGMNLSGLLVIEYVFHVTLIVTGALLCFAVATLATAPAPAPGKATTAGSARPGKA